MKIRQVFEIDHDGSTVRVTYGSNGHLSCDCMLCRSLGDLNPECLFKDFVRLYTSSFVDNSSIRKRTAWSQLR